MALRRDVENVESQHLPPRELWLFDPSTHEKHPTPLDAHGLVDADELIKLVKSAFDPSYVWRLGQLVDRHHLNWRHGNYPNLPEEAVNPHEFCELPSNKILVPRLFHTCIHLMTIEPPVPRREIMQQRILAYKTSKAVYDSASLSTRLTRVSKQPTPNLKDAIERERENFYNVLEKARAVPEEFQLINLSSYNVDSFDDARDLTAKLGAFTVRGSTTRVRDVLRHTAA